NYVPTVPRLLGTRVFNDYSLEELSDYIDWTPFLQTWALKGRYPEILDDPSVGEEAGKLISDAKRLLERISADRMIRARGVIGIFAANSNHDDDVVIYSDESREKVLATIHNLRQQMQKPPGRPNRCLSDFVAPEASRVKDFLGGFVVSAGFGVEELARSFERQHDDYSAILTKALADRLAEAFAERIHQRVRSEFWAYDGGEDLEKAALTREQYQGIRPAPGYPAFPDHSEKTILFDFLDANRKIGVELTESFAMTPAASVCGLYYSHPESHYFGVGRIARDQVEDYAARKGVQVRKVERWLSPILGYDAG
ncbi:MAG: vitamin B12 dependent-methionine synthase activation domain-containing protein, partial [bacterium]